MSDAVLIAIITNGTIILVAILSRWMSHTEHKETKRDVKQIKAAMNGQIEGQQD